MLSRWSSTPNRRRYKQGKNAKHFDRKFEKLWRQGIIRKVWPSTDCEYFSSAQLLWSLIESALRRIFPVLLIIYQNPKVVIEQVAFAGELWACRLSQWLFFASFPLCPQTALPCCPSMEFPRKCTKLAVGKWIQAFVRYCQIWLSFHHLSSNIDAAQGEFSLQSFGLKVWTEHRLKF